jgi:formylglycine-generating enzyme required for sulfatase activity
MAVAVPMPGKPGSVRNSIEPPPGGVNHATRPDRRSRRCWHNVAQVAGFDARAAWGRGSWAAFSSVTVARRLDDPEDWVRLEIEESLKRPGLRVVPLLVGNATMPKAADLPASLRLLARRNAHEISDKRWDYDLSQLVKALKPVAALAGGSKLGWEPPAVRAAEWPSGKVFRDGDEGPEMIVIPAGEFVMGSPKSEAGRRDDEGPQHRVWIAKPFAIGRYAVTVGEFGRFVQVSGYQTEAERNPEQGIRAWDDSKGEWNWSKGKSWRNPGFAQDDRHPVVGVSWNDGLAYVKWLGEQTARAYRLPSEAEWEYAARAGTTTARFWADDPNQAFRYANVADRSLKAAHPKWPWPIHECDDGYAETAPVGSFAPTLSVCTT